MNIGIVGSGISGLTCAMLLGDRHDVTLYERDDRLGGHTCTVPVRHEGRELAVDTGFIVFNERNYPNFCALLKRLGVESRATTMSFSVHDDATDFEYGGTSLSGLIGSPANLLNSRWWRIVNGVASLGRTGKSLLQTVGPDETIIDLCRRGVWSRELVNDYLVPMAAAIWSAPRDRLLTFPARFFLRFFDNHGMLNLKERPQWRTIVGGSSTYIGALLRNKTFNVRKGAAVVRVTRSAERVRLQLTNGETADHDHVVIAAHSGQALEMLADPSAAEREVLAEMPYQPNTAILHTDAKRLPRRRRCWAAWNYRVHADAARPVSVTYNMTILQGLETREPICVSLNDDEVEPSRIIAKFHYEHPIYTMAGETARQRWNEINGVHRTHFCGAYWGNGFHEDGVVSAQRVCRSLGITA